jgi:hypothetical protein
MTDLPGRLLTAAARFLPPGRFEWGRAMVAELAAVEGRRERWRFTLGCLRTAAGQLHVLRAAVHLAVVLGALGAVFAWSSTIGYRPLAWPLDLVASALAVACWQARRASMLGPLGDGATAWLLRLGGYLLAAGVAATAVLHAHPATPAEAESGVGPLVTGVVVAAYLLGLVVVTARRSAATTRLRLTATGCATAAALTWLLAVAAAPPIPPSTGWALALTAVAAVAALLMNSATAGRALLAALLSAALASALIFCAVALLARFGPDAAIPPLTPYAPPPTRVSESRIELIDPYMLLLALGGLLATALAITGVATRRPPPAGAARRTVAPS